MLSASVTTILFTGLVKQCCLGAVGKGGQTCIQLHVLSTLWSIRTAHAWGHYNRKCCLHSDAKSMMRYEIFITHLVIPLLIGLLVSYCLQKMQLCRVQEGPVWPKRYWSNSLSCQTPFQQKENKYINLRDRVQAATLQVSALWLVHLPLLKTAAIVSRVQRIASTPSTLILWWN